MPTDKTSESLWAELRKSLLPFVRSRVPSREIAEDIVHDVFLKIARRIADLRDDERLQPWAFRIARNAIADYYRRTNREELEASVFQGLPQADHKEDLTTEVASWLPRFLDELPPADRSLLQQVELEGIAQKELATATGVPYSSLKSKVQRARVKLKQLIEDCCSIDFDKHGNVVDYRSQNCDC